MFLSLPAQVLNAKAQSDVGLAAPPPAQPPSMAMRVMRIRHMTVHVPKGLVLVPMAVLACGHGIVRVLVQVFVVAVIVPMRVFMCQHLMTMLMVMGLDQMQHHTGQHQRAAQSHHGAG